MNIQPEEATREQIEDAIAEWRGARELRLSIEKEAAAVRATETTLKDFIVAAMRSQVYEAVVKGGRQTYVRTTQVPVAEDRQAFEAYILAEGDLSLLQFRPAVGAIKERLEAGVSVPGITMLDTYDLGDKKA